MRQNAHIYLVDDDIDFREATCELLVSAGFSVASFSTGQHMLDQLDPEWPGAILCDVRMAGMDGFAVLKAAHGVASDIPFIMITGHGDVRLAIKSIKAGAYDFIEKPVQPDFLIRTMNRAIAARKLIIENRRLRRRVQRGAWLSGTIEGRSKAIRNIRADVLRLASLPVSVCIFGETGTGKAVVARALHDFGEGPGDCVTIACGSTTPDDFRAALADLKANTTTLFLRSLNRLDEKSQASLADYLRSSGTPRIIASMSGSAESSPEESLSDELYFLANVARLDMPPLRERGRDVLYLLEIFLRLASRRLGQRPPKITPETIKMLERHSWPGNARELQNVAERLVICLPIDLGTRTTQRGEIPTSYDKAMQQFEKSLLAQCLRETGGRKGEAAELLAIPRKRLYLRMKALGLASSGQN